MPGLSLGTYKNTFVISHSRGFTEIDVEMTVSSARRLNQGASSQSPAITINSRETTYDDQNYDRWSEGHFSHIVENNTGYSRIEAVDDGVMTIEYYDKQFKYLSTKTVPVELKQYVDFYEGAKHYYLMFSQDNPSQSASVETFRIVQYDKDWNRLKSISLKDNNTIGMKTLRSADFAEFGGNLLIHTNHTMYKSSDGLNHQANLRFTINIESMKLVNQSSKVSNNKTGYVSHSFNQLIDVSSDGYIVTADHGDAFPRSIVMFNWKNPNLTTPNPSVAEVFSIKGSNGDNDTGVKIGGLEVSSTSVLLAGTSVTQNNNFGNNADHNVFVTSTPRDNFNTKASTINWITKYDGKSIAASNPYLLEVKKDIFILLWNELTESTSSYFGDDDDKDLDIATALCWTTINEKGEQEGGIYQVENAYISSVHPILNSDSNVIWYATNRSVPVFYTLNVNTNQIEATPTR